MEGGGHGQCIAPQMKVGAVGPLIFTATKRLKRGRRGGDCDGHEGARNDERSLSRGPGRGLLADGTFPLLLRWTVPAQSSCVFTASVRSNPPASRSLELPGIHHSNPPQRVGLSSASAIDDRWIEDVRHGTIVLA